MQKIDFNSEYFNPKDVLECGQIFRFEPHKVGYKVYSADKACYVYTEGNSTVVESDFPDYFYNFFDLGREYAQVIEKIKEFNNPSITRACEVAKGLRLLNQDPEEMIFSFIISQNNNIPRIKGIISRICENLGEKREFEGGEYYTFPTAARLAERDAAFYKSLGAGYRDEFIAQTARRIAAEGISHLDGLDAPELKKQLLGYHGIGPKVADCISLFGYHKAASFPVDTWVEKIYREDFGGSLKDRNKINLYFTSLFGEYSGYVQQYLFYAKRENL
ncbi:MAG: hypothetical protein K2K39_03700 [Clostridia bacterium]|nr:hypothetical protein [Clostridia bacterium]